MHESDFLKAIEAAPSDDALKLVYADYLDDQGDLRGQILRLACELRRVLKEAEPDEEWLEALRVQIERGLPIVLDPGEAVYRFELAGWEFSASVRGTVPGTYNLIPRDGILLVELQAAVHVGIDPSNPQGDRMAFMDSLVCIGGPFHGQRQFVPPGLALVSIPSVVQSPPSVRDGLGIRREPVDIIYRRQTVRGPGWREERDYLFHNALSEDEAMRLVTEIENREPR